MPAPVERPDDVHHRPDRRDDDADVLRKPGPPHLRRPRDPHPQTARRGRRNEVAAKPIQRRDAETQREAQRKQRPPGKIGIRLFPMSSLRQPCSASDSPSLSVLTCFCLLCASLCASLCVLCVSALNGPLPTPYLPSKSCNAPPNSGKPHWNPAASGAAGSTRWLASRTSDISPNSSFSPNAGTGKIAGRWTALARTCVKSAL